MEKGFAKFHGNYEHLVGGIGANATRNLIGTPGVEHYHNKISMEEVWDLIVKHDDMDSVLLTGTKCGCD